MIKKNSKSARMLAIMENTSRPKIKTIQQMRELSKKFKIPLSDVTLYSLRKQLKDKQSNNSEPITNNVLTPMLIKQVLIVNKVVEKVGLEEVKKIIASLE